MRAYKANMIPGGVTPTINVSQYDNDYAVTVTLIEGAEIYTPPAGATIRVEGTKPDGHGFEYPCTYQGNVVTMPIYTQMTVVSGRFPIELVVYQNGLRVGSCNIVFAVEKAPLGEDTDISETVLPDIIDAAQASAEAAQEAAEDAAESAEQAAQSAASLTVDTELSSTSTNPVQNKVIDATVTKLKNELSDTTESTRNLFNLYDIDIGKNGTGASYANRAISAPIYVGTDAYTVSCANLPPNLKYEIDGYTSTEISSRTGTIVSWISSADTVTTKTPSTYTYIRVLLGSVNDAALTLSDFSGLKLQVEKGSGKTDYINHFIALDKTARQKADKAFEEIGKIDNELLTDKMEWSIGGITNISSYTGYGTNTYNVRVRTIANISLPRITIDPKNSGCSFQLAIFDASGNLLSPSQLPWYTDKYELEVAGIAQVRINVKKSVNGSDVAISPSEILAAGFTVSVDPNPISTFRDVTIALQGLTPVKVNVMAYNVGHYAYGTQNGYSGDDVADKVTKWKSFIARHNVDILGLEEWQRYFDLNSTIDALADMWTPLYKYHEGLISSLFSVHNIFNVTTGYLGDDDPSTQRYYVKGYVIIHGLKICVIAVHLSPAIPDAIAVRANQITDLLNILADEERVIIFGDFNAATSDEYDPFVTAGYKLANGGYLGWMNTHAPQESTKYFDNIIVSSNIVVSNFDVLYDEYSNLTSDHYPLIAELTVY